MDQCVYFNNKLLYLYLTHIIIYTYLTHIIVAILGFFSGVVRTNDLLQ